MGRAGKCSHLAASTGQSSSQHIPVSRGIRGPGEDGGGQPHRLMPSARPVGFPAGSPPEAHALPTPAWTAQAARVLQVACGRLERVLDQKVPVLTSRPITAILSCLQPSLHVSELLLAQQPGADFLLEERRRPGPGGLSLVGFTASSVACVPVGKARRSESGEQGANPSSPAASPGWVVGSWPDCARTFLWGPRSW